MAQLFAVGLLYGFIEPGKQLQTRACDAGHYGTAVPGLAGPRYEAALFQPTEQASDIRIPRNHSFGDFATGEPFRGTAEDPQHVVLRRREILRLENRNQPA